MTTIDYALMMLSLYEDDEPLNIEAIRHYRRLAEQERERMSSKYNSNTVVFPKYVVDNQTNTRTNEN